MRSLSNILSILFLLLAHFTSFSQNQDFRFRSFGIKEGLSQSSVFSIYQDRKGLLWIATSDGLNQFDGYQFNTYKSNHSDPNSLSDSWVTAILMEDSQDNLWMVTADRIINKLNLRNKQITRLSFGKPDSSISRLEQLYYLFEDSRKNIWISSNLGICRYQNTGSRMQDFFNDRTCPLGHNGNFASYIQEDKEGNIWFATQDGLLRYLYKSGKFESFRNVTGNDNSLLTNDIIWIGNDNQRHLWNLTSRGLCLFHEDTKSFSTYPFPAAQKITDSRSTFFSTRIDKNGNIWTGTDFGLFRFETNRRQYSYFQKGSDGSLSDNKITYLFQDSRGNIWVGTADGLNYYDPGKNNFKRFDGNFPEERLVSQILEDKNGEIWILGRIDPSRGGWLGHVNKSSGKIELMSSDKCNPNSIASSFVYSPYKDQTGNVWYASFGDGLIEYTPRSNRFETYSPMPGNPNSPGGNSIWGFAEDRKGNLWIPLLNRGVDKFNPKTKQFTHFIPKGIRLFSIFNISAGSNDDMWLSTVGGGLLYLNTRTEQFKQYLHDPKKPNSIASNFMRKIILDPSGKLWIGHASNGFDLFDPKTQEAVHFTHNPSDKNSLANNNTWTLLLDHNKELWISCEGYIDRYNSKTGKFTHYKSKSDNGINADKALCMYEDASGNIWFGTSGGGLSLFNRATGTFRHWTEEEGLPNNVIYGILEDDSQNLWLSTNKGLSKFNVRKNSFTNYDENDGLQSNEFNMGSCYKSSDNKLYFGGINGFNAFYPERIIPDTTRLKTILTGFQIFNKSIGIVPPEKQNLVSPEDPNWLLTDGQTYYLPQDISYSNEITLTYKEKVFTIEYAALFFDSPDKVTYRYMMENFDANWNEAGRRRFATYTNLPAGEYTFLVSASNADGTWNPNPTKLKIIILPPFWQTWWFYILEALFIFGILMMIIRLRVTNLRKAKKQLEKNVQERTREIQEKNEELELRNIQILKQKEEIAAQAQKLKGELVIQNQMSEMALLKSQINPHFLFNTLNNIYSLVYQRSTEAPEAIMKLSEIMRYMLYDATSDKVLLQNEINYLKSFIELQLLRIKNRDFVSFSISGNLGGRVISPMLLISFVENAFKHGVKKGTNPGITINLEVTDNKINFEIVNFSQKNGSVNKDKTGGIGLTNVKRRLELLYHNRFKLDIHQNEEVYHVKLELEE